MCVGYGGLVGPFHPYSGAVSIAELQQLGEIV